MTPEQLAETDDDTPDIVAINISGKVTDTLRNTHGVTVMPSTIE